MFKTPIRQTWYDLFFINELITNIQFDHFIELGTYQGGLTVFLGLHALSQGVNVITFDIRQEPGNKGWMCFKFILPITFYQLNVFSEEVLKIVDKKMKTGRSLLILDGGDKPKDFITYAPLLRGGDVVLIHDKGKYIFDYQVNNIAEENGLIPFYQEEADRIGTRLFTFIKENRKKKDDTMET